MNIQFGNYGQNRELVCTEQERQVYNVILEILSEAGLDISPMVLVRKSDNYVSACMHRHDDSGDLDVARIKFTNRAKWIKTGSRYEKVSIEDPEDVRQLSDEIIDTYRRHLPYL